MAYREMQPLEIGCPAGRHVDCEVNHAADFENTTNLLKYLIRRTDVTILVHNTRVAFRRSTINQNLGDMIEHLFDYALGLVEYTLKIEDIPPYSTRILQWLLLSYGGDRPWNKFARKAERDIKTAIKLAEKQQQDLPCLCELQRAVNNLTIYLDMLQVSMECDVDGARTEQGEVREALELERGKIPTTKQERLAFRVARALVELESMRDVILQSDNPTSTKGPEEEPQVYPEETEADTGKLASSSSQAPVDQELPATCQTPVAPGASATQPSSNTQVPQGRPDTPGCLFSEGSVNEAMRKLSRGPLLLEEMFEGFDILFDVLIEQIEWHEKRWAKYVESRKSGIQEETETAQDSRPESRERSNSGLSSTFVEGSEVSVTVALEASTELDVEAIANILEDQSGVKPVDEGEVVVDESEVAVDEGGAAVDKREVTEKGEVEQQAENEREPTT